MNARFLQILLWLCVVSAVLADYNITIDDTDPTIGYSPPNAWTRVRDDTTKDRYGESTSLTTTLGARATLNFTGATAIYFMSYGLVGGGEVTILFDGSPLTVSLQSTGNAKARRIVYSKKLIDANATHTIVVSNDRGVSLEVDAFISTLPGDRPPGVSTPPDPTEIPTPSQRPNAGAIAGATVGACIALLAFVGASFWYLRKRRIQSKTAEPLPLTATNLPATTPRQIPEIRAAASSARTMATPSQTALPELPAKAEYRGNTIPSTLSGSGSSAAMTSSVGARNTAPIIYSSPPSHLTVEIPPSPPHSPYPLLPPPSYGAAASDLQIHEEHSGP